MPFIGNQPALSYTSFAKQDFSTSATTSYTLDNPVANANELALFINFVRQEPTTAYSASGTSLTLTSATASSDDMYCVYLGKAVQTVNPPNASVGLSQLTASGTKDATTFLRGDNTFASAGGDNTPAFSVRQTTNQTGISSDTLTKISFQSEVFDTDNAFASDKFTVPSGKAGRYFFDASTRIRSATVFQLRNAVIYIYKNGSAMGDQYSAHYNSNLMLESRQNYSFVDDASVGDYYEVYAAGTVDSGTANLYQTTFTGFKILE